MPDHLHLFFGMRPVQSISELMRIVKSNSSEWINRNKFTPSQFRWQEGFGAFSYSKSQIKTVADYVENQERHHRGVSFREEYKRVLEVFDVQYDDRYIFHEPV